MVHDEQEIIYHKACKSLTVDLKCHSTPQSGTQCSAKYF